MYIYMKHSFSTLVMSLPNMETCEYIAIRYKTCWRASTEGQYLKKVKLNKSFI